MVSPFADIRMEYVRPPLARSAPRPRVLSAEAEALRARLPSRCYSVGLSQEGRQLDSAGFARWLDSRRADSLPLAFLVGGVFGLAPEMKRECRQTLSLSQLTFSHRIALVVLLEQLYRASTILTGHPYHK